MFIYSTLKLYLPFIDTHRFGNEFLTYSNLTNFDWKKKKLINGEIEFCK